MNILYACSDRSNTSNSLKRYFYFKRKFKTELIYLDYKFLYKKNDLNKIEKQNDYFYKKFQEVKPDLVVLDKILTITSETLIRVRKIKNCKIINFTNDNPFTQLRPKEKNIWHYYIKNISMVDANFFTQDEQFSQYANFGSKKNFRMQHGFDPRDIKHIRLINDFRDKIVFIGNYEKDRHEYLQNLFNNFKKDIFFAGPNWWKDFKNIKYILLGCLKNKIIEPEYMCNIFYSTQINLGLLSKTNNDSITRRTYEIMSSKGFGLYKFSENHQKIFSFDQMFSDSHDLIDKIKFFKINSDLRLNLLNKNLEMFQKLKSDIPSMIDRWIIFLSSNDNYKNDFNDQLNK